MDYTDTEVRAIHFLATEYEAGRQTLSREALAEDAGIDAHQALSLVGKLCGWSFLDDQTKLNRYAERQSPERLRILPAVVDESRRLHAARDKVEYTIKWLRKHKWWSRAILGFLAASLIVTFLNGLIDLVQTIRGWFR